jgi:hypothetical protein
LTAAGDSALRVNARLFVSPLASISQNQQAAIQTCLKQENGRKSRQFGGGSPWTDNRKRSADLDPLGLLPAAVLSTPPSSQFSSVVGF